MVGFLTSIGGERVMFETLKTTIMILRLSSPCGGFQAQVPPLGLSFPEACVLARELPGASELARETTRERRSPASINSLML